MGSCRVLVVWIWPDHRLQQRTKVLSHLSKQGFAWVDSIYPGLVFGTTALELIKREVRHVRTNPVNDVFIEA